MKNHYFNYKRKIVGKIGKKMFCSRFKKVTFFELLLFVSLIILNESASMTNSPALSPEAKFNVIKTAFNVIETVLIN